MTSYVHWTNVMMFSFKHDRLGSIVSIARQDTVKSTYWINLEMNPLMKITKSFPLCTSILWQFVCSIIKHKWRLFGYLLDKLKGIVLLQNLLLLTNCTDYNHSWSETLIFVFTGFRLAAMPIVSKRPFNRNLTITITRTTEIINRSLSSRVQSCW